MDNREEMQQRAAFLRKRLLTLEWDKRLNQLNSGMAPKLSEYKKELEEIRHKLDQETQDSSPPPAASQ